MLLAPARAARPALGLAVGVLLTLGSVGCGGAPVAPTAGSAGGQTAHEADHEADHGADGEGEGEDSHDGSHQGHYSDAELARLLVTARRLPAGYQAGHAHRGEAGAAPTLDEACQPIAELIGSHPRVRQTEHPEAERVFSKSHFGPTVTEVVIDYGVEAEAAAAVDRLAAAAQTCERYEHSTSRIGARSYQVQPVRALAAYPGGHQVRLQAAGRDFAGIHWDLWWAQYGPRVIGVSLRTAPGGTTADLDDAVDAAVGHLPATYS